MTSLLQSLIMWVYGTFVYDEVVSAQAYTSLVETTQEDIVKK